MEQLLQFIAAHWVLCLLFVVVALLIVVEEIRSRNSGGIKKLSPQQCVQLVNRQNALVIDVRSLEAFQDGHLPSAVNVASEKFSSSEQPITETDLNRPIVIVCQNGQNSLTIAAKLRKQRFHQVYTLAGGIAGWKQSQLPLVKA